MPGTLDTDLQREFDAIVAGEPIVDRHEVFARLRAEAPVFFSGTLGAWVVSRHADVRAGLEDRERFVPITEGAGAPVFGGGPLWWRGREHNKKSGIVGKRIRSPRAIRDELAPQVERIAHSVAAGLPLGEPLDLKEEYAFWVPLLVITELTAIDDAAKLRHWYDAILYGGTSSIGNPAARQAGLDAMRQLKEFLTPIFAERRHKPGADLVSDLVTATYDGAPLADDEIGSIVGQLLPAGVETTERVLTSAFRHLALDPALWDELRSQRDDDAALASFAAEALRFYPPLQAINRVALAAATIGGVEIAAGEKTVFLIASANRDADRFPEAQRFDAARFLDSPDRQFTSAGDILPFGGGEHHCTGSRLAETEIVHGLRALMERVGRIELLEPCEPVGRLLLYSPPALRVVLHPAP